MKHQFYPHKPDDNFVDATLVGYLDFDPATRQIKSFKLVTDQATYGTTKFDAVAGAEP